MSFGVPLLPTDGPVASAAASHLEDLLAVLDLLDSIVDKTLNDD